jgi:hypothetical protein
MKMRILSDIRNDDIPGAVELLEMRLDSTILTIDAGDNLSERTNKAINKTINSAKAYRLKYPRKTNNQIIDETVSGALEK